MDEITCQMARPRTLSHQRLIEKTIHKEKVTSVLKPNAFYEANFQYKTDDKAAEFSKKKKVLVCLTRVSPDDQKSHTDDSSSLPKFHITISVKEEDQNKEEKSKNGEKDTNDSKNGENTQNINFLAFLINQDYMINSSLIEFTRKMGCPYHITLSDIEEI